MTGHLLLELMKRKKKIVRKKQQKNEEKVGKCTKLSKEILP